MSEESTPASDEPEDPLEASANAPDQSELVEAPVFHVMSIESVLFDLSDTSPLVHIIEEEPPYRYLAIPIALAEAVALHNALDKIDGRRPGTHEVMAEVLRRLNADIVAARITRYDAGVFFFDCRTSDALILATRQNVRAPVLCAESVLQAFYP
jgi:bifunctional DNase/RNase